MWGIRSRVGFLVQSTIMFSCMLAAQDAVTAKQKMRTPEQVQSAASASLATQESGAQPGERADAPANVASEQSRAPEQRQFTIPAGTKLLVALASPLHSTSAVPNSGLYARIAMPVVADGRVLLPVGTQVIGTVAQEKRPGHFARHAQFRMRFESIVFADNSAAQLGAHLLSVPGSSELRIQDSEGLLQPVDQAEKVIIPMLAGAAIGALAGSVHTTGIGRGGGAALGAGVGLGSVLLTRGDAITLPQGTRLEVVLDRPLVVNEAQTVSPARAAPQIPAQEAPVRVDRRQRQAQPRAPLATCLLFHLC